MTNPTPNSLAILRPFPSSFPSLSHPSTALIRTDVPSRAWPRTWSLSTISASSTPPPIISRSPFLPLPLVEHLMRNKRDSAITTKYLPHTAITNGEAALHSFVTALARVVQCADYRWEGGHSAVPLGTVADEHGREVRLGRRVVLSTLLHHDFENGEVAEVFYRLEEDEAVEGVDLGADFRIPSVEEKNDPVFRSAYDRQLKQHAVFHLLPSSRLLPALSSLPPSAIWSIPETTQHLQAHLFAPPGLITPFTLLQDRFVRLPDPPHSVLSLEFLLASYVAALVNELSALEALTTAGEGGYAYTFDPPAIFARRFPAELSTLLVLAALREILLSSPSVSSPRPVLGRMRLFALTAFTPALAALLPLLRRVLPDHVRVMDRTELYCGEEGRLGSEEAVPELKGATLVIHNNSDAFGQNIQSESAGGSVDGVVGAWGDAARALRRERGDLVDWVA
ncbi:hypothetical protein JCM8097_001171 [Rhodosporidiobolus ruineniae]